MLPTTDGGDVIDCSRLLIDYSPAGTAADIQALPTARLFKLSAFGWQGRNAIGFFRSAWSTEAEGASGKHSYLAFKAANGVPNHNDLDGGTFVFEAGGQRWGMDLSADDYQLKNYFTQSLEYRYGYYRKSTAGHNTLTFDNDGIDNSNRGACDQDPGMTGRTEITLFEGSDTDRPAAAAAAGASRSSPAYSIVDLTAAYSPQNSSRVERGFAFTESYEHLLIVDEFEFAAGSSVNNVTWSMHTMASIKLNAGTGSSSVGGSAAVLSLGGATLHARVVEPKGASFSTAEVNLLPPFRASAGVSKLMVALPITLEGSGGATRIVVGLSLSSVAAAVTPNSLAQWGAFGPFAGE